MEVYKMGKYGKAAVSAVEKIKSGEVGDPVEAWEIATGELFGWGSSGQCKGCPKGAFLGLCEEGALKDIDQGSYTRSEKNKSYALKAVDVLRKHPEGVFSERMLWNEVLNGEEKKYNQQMDVVLALWNSDFIE